MLFVLFPSGFPYNKLLTRTLYLQVLDYDRFSRDDPIGEVCIPLGDFDLVRGQTLWKNLQISKGHAVPSLDPILNIYRLHLVMRKPFPALGSNTDCKSSEPLKTLVMLCYVLSPAHSICGS